MSDTDNVNHPSHYTMYEHEVIELTRSLSFDAGNACKYIIRAPFKDANKQDLEKALWYAKDFLNSKINVSDYTNDQRKQILALASYFATQIESRKGIFPAFAKLLIVIVGIDTDQVKPSNSSKNLLSTVIEICEKVL